MLHSTQNRILRRFEYFFVALAPAARSLRGRRAARADVSHTGFPTLASAKQRRRAAGQRKEANPPQESKGSRTSFRTHRIVRSPSQNAKFSIHWSHLQVLSHDDIMITAKEPISPKRRRLFYRGSFFSK